MLLHPVLRDGLLYGGVLVAAAAVATWRALRVAAAATRQQGVPDARVVAAGRAAAAARSLAAVLPAVIIAVGLGLAYWAYRHDVAYVVVTDGAGAPEVARRVGSDRTPDVTLAPGVEPLPREIYYEPTWVVNRSSGTVRIETTYYGRHLGFASEPIVIPPGMGAHVVNIEHIGPDDPPPPAVQDEFGLGTSSRNWLTWDR